ncbi:molybdopterin-synthase adenylyltransferase MoeB [Viridibacterium curvum]|uniref:Molybdopterin-synthase adenylyltransferase MoeB n=1 Tax=Viridibacterium curvum TaxID=1101404 RepID=A0ABP9QBQ8_9RHOO
MNDQELLRYSRHILLPELDVAGQEAIRKARVLIVGAGGLGSPAAMYLASAGVGTLILADGDTVDLTNLQRQILHRNDAVGRFKAESGRDMLAALNPDVVTIALPQRLEGTLLDAHIAEADVVLDCCDNFATRHAINRACVRYAKPLVSGAAVRFDGQLSTFDLRNRANPCYHCLFPDGEDVEETRCAVMGIFAPLTGIVGSMQAAEALKLIAGCGESMVGRLLVIDALDMSLRTLRYGKDAGCPICSGSAE